ncbi:hypothetical protein IAU60_002990 [Kwoniella sp. DSM 27419]
MMAQELGYCVEKLVRRNMSPAHDLGITDAGSCDQHGLLPPALRSALPVRGSRHRSGPAKGGEADLTNGQLSSATAKIALACTGDGQPQGRSKPRARAKPQAATGSANYTTGTKAKSRAARSRPGGAEQSPDQGTRFASHGLDGQRQCTNCGETDTPQWRGALCNACALWKRSRGTDRPLPLLFHRKGKGQPTPSLCGDEGGGAGGGVGDDERQMDGLEGLLALGFGHMVKGKYWNRGRGIAMLGIRSDDERVRCEGRSIGDAPGLKRGVSVDGGSPRNKRQRASSMQPVSLET